MRGTLRGRTRAAQNGRRTRTKASWRVQRLHGEEQVRRHPRSWRHRRREEPIARIFGHNIGDLAHERETRPASHRGAPISGSFAPCLLATRLACIAPVAPSSAHGGEQKKRKRRSTRARIIIIVIMVCMRVCRRGMGSNSAGHRRGSEHPSCHFGVASGTPVTSALLHGEPHQLARSPKIPQMWTCSRGA